LTEHQNDTPTYERENWKKRRLSDDDDDDDDDVYVAAEPARTTWSFNDDLRRPVQMAQKLTVS
jgi:hypothetical protein